MGQQLQKSVGQRCRGLDQQIIDGFLVEAQLILGEHPIRLLAVEIADPVRVHFDGPPRFEVADPYAAVQVES